MITISKVVRAAATVGGATLATAYRDFDIVIDELMVAQVRRRI